jgi:hypothetical protein
LPFALLEANIGQSPLLRLIKHQRLASKLRFNYFLPAMSLQDAGKKRRGALRDSRRKAPLLFDVPTGDETLERHVAVSYGDRLFFFQLHLVKTLSRHSEDAGKIEKVLGFRKRVREECDRLVSELEKSGTGSGRTQNPCRRLARRAIECRCRLCLGPCPAKENEKP